MNLLHLLSSNRKINVKVSFLKNYVSGKALEHEEPACLDGRFRVQKDQPKKFWTILARGL